MHRGQADVGVLGDDQVVAVDPAEALAHLDPAVAVAPDDALRQRDRVVDVDVDLAQAVVGGARGQHEVADLAAVEPLARADVMANFCAQSPGVPRPT